jgi:hypothetical protein
VTAFSQPPSSAPREPHEAAWRAGRRHVGEPGGVSLGGHGRIAGTHSARSGPGGPVLTRSHAEKRSVVNRAALSPRRIATLCRCKPPSARTRARLSSTTRFNRCPQPAIQESIDSVSTDTLPPADPHPNRLAYSPTSSPDSIATTPARSEWGRVSPRVSQVHTHRTPILSPPRLLPAAPHSASGAHPLASRPRFSYDFPKMSPRCSPRPLREESQ